MADKFAGYADSVSDQARSWAVITPNDATDLATTPKAIRCNGAGNLVLMGDDGVLVSFSVADREMLALRPKRVLATGTTATGIVALY